MAQDVRRRRAERVRQERLKSWLPRYGKYILVAVVIVAAVGLAANFYTPPPAKKFIHEHPSFAMFIENEEVSFNHVDYDISKISDKVHMHYRGDPASMATWHVESSYPGGVSDTTLADIFAQYGLTFRQGYLKLDTHDNHNGSEWPDRAPKVWRVFVSKSVANETGNQRLPFEEVTGDYSKYVPRDLDKILVTYGDLTPATVAAQQQQVPDPRP